jgi:sulfonate transport system substrate-binding protein
VKLNVVQSLRGKTLRVSLCLAAAFSFLPFVPADAMEHTTLALPDTTLAFLSYYVAADKGLWAKQGLDVKEIEIRGVGAMNAVVSGSVDFSMSSAPSITRAYARGQKLVALATTLDQSDDDIVIRKEIADAAHFKPAESLPDRAKILKGLRIAAPGVAGIPAVVLRAVAAEAGIASDEITLTPLAPPEFMAAFARKAIDGFVAGPPYPQQAVLAGTGVLVSDSSKGEPRKYSPISPALLVARASFCPAHRSICAEMVHGFVEATRFIHEHPRESLAVMKTHFGQFDDAVLRATYELLRVTTASPPKTTVKDLENGQLMDIAAGLLKPSDKLSNYAPLIDNEFVK